MWLTWHFTVAADTTSRSAISVLVRPSAIRREHLDLARREVVRALGCGGAGALTAASTWCWIAGSSAASPRATASTAARICSAPASLVR